MASKTEQKRAGRERRKRAIRKKIHGEASRPRLSVFRSSRHIYAQVIDDVQGNTLVAASTMEKELQTQLEGLKNSDRARLIGKLVAERCLAQSIGQVVFDRNGYIYHGRVQALADGAREGGLDF